MAPHFSRGGNPLRKFVSGYKGCIRNWLCFFFSLAVFLSLDYFFLANRPGVGRTWGP